MSSRQAGSMPSSTRLPASIQKDRPNSRKKRSRVTRQKRMKKPPMTKDSAAIAPISRWLVLVNSFIGDQPVKQRQQCDQRGDQAQLQQVDIGKDDLVQHQDHVGEGKA